MSFLRNVQRNGTFQKNENENAMFDSASDGHNQEHLRRSRARVSFTFEFFYYAFFES